MPRVAARVEEDPEEIAEREYAKVRAKPVSDKINLAKNPAKENIPQNIPLRIYLKKKTLKPLLNLI